MQETEELTLPTTGKKVVVRGYMTGYMDQEIQKILLSANKSHFEKEIDPSTPDSAQQTAGSMKMVMDTDPTVKIDADNKRVELMVVSVDGNTSNVLNLILSLPKADVDYVMAKLQEIEAASKVGDEEKKA